MKNVKFIELDMNLVFNKIENMLTDLVLQAANSNIDPFALDLDNPFSLQNSFIKNLKHESDELKKSMLLACYEDEHELVGSIQTREMDDRLIDFYSKNTLVSECVGVRNFYENGERCMSVEQYYIVFSDLIDFNEIDNMFSLKYLCNENIKH